MVLARTLKHSIIAIFCAFLTGNTKGQSYNPEVPGIVIDHSPASLGVSLGSPCIVITPNGDYIVSTTITSIEKRDRGDIHNTAVFKSTDKGISWDLIADVKNQRWSNIFYHRDALYLLGTYKAFGNAVIRKSVDGGITWTEPTNKKNGLIAEGRYHCAPVPIVIHNGRLWRAMEDAPSGREFRAFMMSASVEADLLDADNWSFTNKLPYSEEWREGFGGWLEGNAVVTPAGELVNVLRCHFARGMHSTAAIVNVSTDGKTASFNPEQDFIVLPGGTSKKFTIRYDQESNKYWSLVNWIQPRDLKYLDELGAGKIRNTLALASCTNLRDWIIERIILYHPDVENHAVQYVDWQFEDQDIIAVARTAYDDGLGGAANYHDANYITFHRVKNFRKSFKSP